MWYMVWRLLHCLDGKDKENTSTILVLNPFRPMEFSIKLHTIDGSLYIFCRVTDYNFRKKSCILVVPFWWFYRFKVNLVMNLVMTY